MGQHKHNPTAIAAKNGEIKKQKHMTKAEQKREFEAAVRAAIIAKVPFIIPRY